MQYSYWQNSTIANPNQILILLVTGLTFIMNEAHKIGKLRNRLKRCTKRLTSKELGSDQRNRIIQRQGELERLLK
jgi:hypothetical protein